MSWVRWAVVSVGVVVSACAGRSEQDSDDEASGVGGTAGASAIGTTGGSVGGTSNSAGSVGGASASVGGTTSPTATVASSSNVGGSGGASASVGGSSGSAGEGGIDATPQPCNSSDGSGCSEGEVCLPSGTESCATSSACGYCAPTLPPSSCDGGLTPCTGSVTCPALPPECPLGFVASIVDECWGECVAADCCACSEDVRCVDDDVSCDLPTGRCVLPAAPEPRCFWPPDPVPCDGYPRVFVFVDGQCQEQAQGLCSSNDNSFFTIEECLRRCEGLPQQGACPEGRVARSTCLGCGPGGGCLATATVCAKSCSTSEECDSGMTCLDSACGTNFCV